MNPRLPRRAALAGLFGALCSPSLALGLGRPPLGGRLSLALPWGLRQMDPHSLNDPLAALLGHACFDTLYAQTAVGQPYPALAAELPTQTEEGVVVSLRPGLKTALGRALNSRDVKWSVNRAKLSGAYPLLYRFGNAERHPKHPGAVVFRAGSPAQIASALSSPLTAILPRRFTPEKPDGTGRFKASFRGGRLLLKRNLFAARGPAYLEQMELQQSADIADGLRRFESEVVNLGWLGRGLHHVRPGSRLIEAPASLGWVVLYAGERAGRWGAPGAAQSMLDAIDASRLSRFALALPARRRAGVRYAGTPGKLLTRQDAPYLLELGRFLAEVLSSPGHELELQTVSASELKRLRQQGDFHFVLDFVRQLNASAVGRQLALLSAVKRTLSHHPPKLRSASPSLEQDTVVARSLPLGIVGRPRIVVASVQKWHGLAEWDLGKVYRDQS